jgi:hypothetical protein
MTRIDECCGARPTGFEPVTFGSVDRRGWAKFGSTEPNLLVGGAKKAPENQRCYRFAPQPIVAVGLRRRPKAPAEELGELLGCRARAEADDPSSKLDV